MCFHVKITKKKEELEKKSKLKFRSYEVFSPSEHFKGFDHPKLPVITDKRDFIELFEWGLLPSWGKDDFNTNNTLNARIETLQEKPSFRDSYMNRCAIYVDGFYEWRHEGKNKIKYDIGIKDNTFFLAGIYNNITFSLVTTEAVGIMDYIHNTKHRMPIALNDNESLNNWLDGAPVIPFTDFSYSADLSNQQLLLF